MWHVGTIGERPVPWRAGVECVETPVPAGEWWEPSGGYNEIVSARL